ncbi:MAG TPA: hypothetical protein VKY57_00420 [Chitinispirillaceae bacterium]|nr:hypothetical protein [Chitinispirillaceae bacterium]
MATCFKVKKNNKGCKFMEVSDKMMGLVCAAFMSMIISVTDTPADEIGLAIGLNSSMYKPWDKNNAEYQKTDILNPIEITFQKNLIKFLGIHSSLQYSKKSISQSMQATDSNFEPVGTIKYENTMNYLSMEISPIVFSRLNNFLIDARLGVSGDFYINETNRFGNESSTIRSKETSSFLLSFVSGIGLGYIIKDRFKIGLRSSISRTLTDIYKDQSDNVDLFYLNFHNVICFSLLI